MCKKYLTNQAKNVAKPLEYINSREDWPMHELEKIKETLNRAIASTVSQREHFVKDSKKDFTRNSKLTFEDMIRILLQAGGQSLFKELTTYFNCAASAPTPSAFCQQRSKIKFETFQYLLTDFVKEIPTPKTYKGYQILAVDGSEIYISKNEKDVETYIYNGAEKNGWNRLHLNAIYDVLNHIYVDAIITPGKQVAERDALLQMASSVTDKTSSIIVADRGYEGYELLYQLLTCNIPFVLRVKKPGSNVSLLTRIDLPDADEFDALITMKVASLDSYKGKRVKTKTENEGYKLIKNNKFSFFTAENKKYAFPAFRVLKLQLNGNEPEYLATNLSAEDFSKEDIKKIYGMRWGIENAFRELKYDFSLMQFHSKKAEHIKQEIYAKLTMYNFCRMITESLESKVNTGEKYAHKINFSQAVFYCKYFFLALVEPPQLKELILRTTLPVRPDRSFRRRIIKKQHKSFQYRIA